MKRVITVAGGLIIIAVLAVVSAFQEHDQALSRLNTCNAQNIEQAGTLKRITEELTSAQKQLASTKLAVYECGNPPSLIGGAPAPVWLYWKKYKQLPDLATPPICGHPFTADGCWTSVCRFEIKGVLHIVKYEMTETEVFKTEIVK